MWVSASPRRIPRRRRESGEKTAPRVLRTGESIADFESAMQKRPLKFAYNSFRTQRFFPKIHNVII